MLREGLKKFHTIAHELSKKNLTKNIKIFCEFIHGKIIFDEITEDSFLNGGRNILFYLNGIGLGFLLVWANLHICLFCFTLGSF